MPLNDQFVSPGAAATSALLEFLADHEAKQRQAMLDEITKSTASRQDEVARGQLAVYQETLLSLKERREAGAELNRQMRALGVIAMLSPGAKRRCRDGGHHPSGRHECPHRSGCTHHRSCLTRHTLQVSRGSSQLGAAAAAVITSIIDTSAETTLVLTGQKEIGTETIVLERYIVEPHYAAWDQP